jgi:hypothetical protein
MMRNLADAVYRQGCRHRRIAMLISSSSGLLDGTAIGQLTQGHYHWWAFACLALGIPVTIWWILGLYGYFRKIRRIKKRLRRDAAIIRIDVYRQGNAPVHRDGKDHSRKMNGE